MAVPYHDLICYSTAGLLISAALWLGWWSLLRDRARGRRRCPKCWYDLRGTPGMRCSECGYTARRERQLQRTHRHWRAAIASFILFAGGAAAGMKPKADRDGWLAFAPTAALVLFVPRLGHEMWFDIKAAQLHVDPVARELVRRDAVRSLSDWEWRYIIGHSGMIRARKLWPKDVPLYISIRMPCWLGTCELKAVSSFLGPTVKGGTLLPESCGNATLGRESWQACQLLGVPPAVGDGIHLECEVVARDGTAKWLLSPNNSFSEEGAAGGVWKGGYELPVRIVPTMADAISPARGSELQHLMRAALKASASLDTRDEYDKVYLQMSLDRAVSAVLNQIAFGFTVEFLLDGEAKETIQVAPTPEETNSGTYPFVAPHSWCASKDIHKRDLTTPKSLDRWTLRIRGDAEMALRDWDRDQYWDGEITLPLSEVLKSN